MIKYKHVLIGAIKNKIIKKHGEYCNLWSLDFQLQWVEKHKVKVSAWQEKHGSTINNTEFTTTMSKNLMRKLNKKFLIFDETEEEKFHKWIYSSLLS